MKKINIKGRMTGLLIIAFITTNALLIYLDEDDRVDRKSYLHTWSQAVTYDLFERVETKGVFTSQESVPVYFDGADGSFQQFLVSEGDKVQEGDDLYTYQVEDYAAEESRLQGEVQRIQEEITAVEDYMDKLEAYDIPDSSSTTDRSTSSFLGEDRNPAEEESSSSPDSSIEAEYLKEEELARQQAELSKQQGLLEMAEDQLDQLQETGEQITVTSQFSGTVTDIDEELNAPILTMKSANLVLEGEIREEDRTQVEENLTVDIFVPELELETTGTVTRVDEFPEQTDLGGKSRYPFIVTLEEADEQLLPGYHAEMQVITAEAPQAVAALDDALTTEENLYAWIMNEEGILERREVTTGMEEDGLVQVVSGLEDGEWMAVAPKDEFRNASVFLTSMQVEDLPIKDLIELDQSTMLNYGLLGLLSR
ncbi:efflux RND transporter periplasmic adaptor subunit [Halobacillus kuroshimensis]|uniref:efflux RND transporter periplasmic adaptor subunit n=1 Tax=Halobacillus kuroshimensis TaxID=302481 RepID=UPI0004288AD9|nr:efflux RND transporter periplasmic adaptor subunit [Halobacillus kuroshimensis]